MDPIWTKLLNKNNNNQGGTRPIFRDETKTEKLYSWKFTNIFYRAKILFLYKILNNYNTIEYFHNQPLLTLTCSPDLFEINDLFFF